MKDKEANPYSSPQQGNAPQSRDGDFRFRIMLVLIALLFIVFAGLVGVLPYLKYGQHETFNYVTAFGFLFLMCDAVVIVVLLFRYQR